MPEEQTEHRTEHPAADQVEASAPAATATSTLKPGSRPNRASWLREYETIYLMPPDITDEAADKIAERLRDLVAKNAGRVIKFTTWGRRKTAFEVRRQPRALYLQMSYLGLGQTVSEVERNLRNMEEVEKFLTTVVNKLVDPASRPTEPDVKLSSEVEERPLRSDRAERVTASTPTSPTTSSPISTRSNNLQERHQMARPGMGESKARRLRRQSPTEGVAWAAGRAMGGGMGAVKRVAGRGRGGSPGFGRRKAACRYCADKNAKVDYKDYTQLKYFLTERGKIIPRRISGNCAMHQARRWPSPSSARGRSRSCRTRS